MFEGLPGVFYVVFAWTAYVYTIYTYGVAIIHYDFWQVDDPRGCGIWEFLCVLKHIFVTQDQVYMRREKSWEGWQGDRLSIYANNLFWMGLFMLQHTGMKKLAFKNKIFPVSERLERPLYVFTAAFTFHMCFKMQCPLPTVIFEFENWYIGAVTGLSVFAAQLLLLKVTFILDHWSFMGITQALQKEPPNLPFGKQGMYGIMRHPQYFFQFIAFWARSRMTEGDLLFSSCMTLYILIVVKFSEEPALIELIGPDYVEYTETVPAYCPLKMIGCFCS